MNHFISQKLLKFVVTGSALLFSSAYSQAIELAPPVAAKRVKIDVHHGDRRIDNYFWMREKSNPEVIDYLQAENAYAEAVLKTSKPLQEKLFDEMKGRIPATETTVPYRQGNYYYYSRNYHYCYQY